MKAKRGFTIVELAIAIAVVAVLAAVAIPTFSGIIGKATISADTKTVHDMNVILTAESSAKPAPADIHSVVELLRKNGIDDLLPLTEFYTFYWIKSENVIILADDADTPIYPEEHADKYHTEGDWFALDESFAAPIPTQPESSDETQEPNEPQTFTVTVRQTGVSTPITFENIPMTVNAGEAFSLAVTIPAEMQDRHSIEKLTVIMRDGDTQHKFVARSKLGEILGRDAAFDRTETATIEIPCVTGEITVNIAIRVYTIVTRRADNGEHFKQGNGTYRILDYDKAKNLFIDDSFIEGFLMKEGYRIVSAKGTQNGRDLGELYDAKKNRIYSSSVLLNQDIDIYVKTEILHHNISLIVKDQSSNELMKTEEIKAYYDFESGEISYTFDMPAELIGKVVEINTIYPNPSASDEEKKPIFNYDSTTNTLKVSNITYDFTIQCFLKVT